ncbi:MAG: MutS-related protein [Candidatus Hodarchaeales archaeon]|jgi:DNA mismatch repair protein MutS
MGIHEQFFNIETEACKKYGEKTLVFLQCGSFFETYGYKKNGQFRNKYYTEYSRICDFCMKEKNLNYKGYDVWMIGFPDYCLEKYVPKMTREGFTIVIWTQADDPTKIRSLHSVCSPGTDFNNTTKHITNYSMCMWVKKTQSLLLNKAPELICGMSAIDILTGDTHIFEYREKYFHNPTTFDEIERFYSSYSPNEILVIHETTDEEIRDILQFSQIDCDKIHLIRLDDVENSHQNIAKKCENQTYIQGQLRQFYDILEYHVFCQTHRLDEHQMATQAFCFHLNFIYNCNPNLVKKIKKPLFDNEGNRLILGNHSLKQLNIINNQQHRGVLASVSNFVNKCNTPMGKRKMHNKLINPICDSKELKNQYKITEYVRNNFAMFENIRKELKNIGDFERLYRKLILQRVAPAELSQFYNSLNIILKVYITLKSDKKLHEHIKCPNLSKKCKKLMKILDKNMVLSESAKISTVRFDVNIFKRGIYEELDNLEREWVESKDKLEALRKYMERFIIKYKGKKTQHMIKYHETDKNGLFLSMTSNRVKILKEELKKDKEGMNERSISYKSNYTNETKQLFFNPHEVQYIKHTKSNMRLDNTLLNNIYHSIFSDKESLKKELADVYKKFIVSLQDYSEQIESIVHYVTELDMILTKAFIAKKYNYCMPIIDDSAPHSFLKAKEIRHILIENLQENEIYVPNDIELGRNTEQNGILLYGTNAVGKSSLIRSIGICVIMAQAGLFVPCTKFLFKPYKSIFTRILGNDNLFKGLSTFAVEMSELRTILNNSTADSLILGDELCSGTETTSATSIFMAGILKLHELQSSFIFATHFHEITDEPRLKSLDHLAFKHMAVHYDKANDCLIYNRKLQDGPGLSMYGLEVCRSLHLPDDFLEMANNIRKERAGDKSIMERNTARYNNKKIKGQCEMCGEDGIDVHHLMPQNLADENGFIGSFHKNHKANLMNICKDCHKKETKSKSKKIRTKTTKGMRLLNE